MPHVQWEQHQPLKSSPLTRIKCLFIQLPLLAFDSSSGTAGWKTSMQSSAEGELLLLAARGYFPRDRRDTK